MCFDIDPSTVFMLKPFINFTEGADSMRLTGAISVSVNTHGDKERVPFHWHNQLCQSLQEKRGLDCGH